MNEVENMYENAGIKSKAECTSKVCIVTNPHKDWCNKCESLKYEYPPFTAEKQLELIKWLAIKGDFEYTVDIAKNTDAYWTIYFDDSRWTAREFEESLAGLINDLWQSLTEEECKQIKEILE